MAFASTDTERNETNKPKANEKNVYPVYTCGLFGLCWYVSLQGGDMTGCAQRADVGEEIAKSLPCRTYTYGSVYGLSMIRPPADVPCMCVVYVTFIFSPLYA